MNKSKTAALFAVLAAALYAINVPFSKIMLLHIEPTMMAAFLYLGAGAGLILYTILGKLTRKNTITEPLTKKELPYTAAMIVLDIAAPILMMYGISKTTSANVSLLNNFEIVATSIIALVVFKEVISKRLWIAIFLVIAASVILGFEGTDGLVFNSGSLFVLGACVCWGFENNCTKMLSSKSSVEIVMIKGCFSGLGSLIIGFFTGEGLPDLHWIGMAMILGFISYGLSISFYIKAQKEIGAAKTSAFYSIAPFLGVAFSMLLGEHPEPKFYAALLIMIVSTVFMVKDTVLLQHNHLHTHVHTHEHSHGDIIHTHQHAHTHSHIHVHNGSEEIHSHYHSDFAEHNHSHQSA